MNEHERSKAARAYDEWLTLFANRDEVADYYADRLTDSASTWDAWPEINAAIVRRWSISGLTYIKTRAWKLVRARVSERSSPLPGVSAGDG